jgi:outer membrane protein assembly factor BamB
VANGVVYVGTVEPDKRLYAFNAATGALLWSYHIGLDLSSPAVADGRVFVGSYDGNVYAFGLP